MSERTFNLNVVSPDRNLVKDLPVVAVGAPGSEGAFTALPGHVPFLTDLKPALMWYRTPDQNVRKILVTGGFVEVLPDRVTVLADSAEYEGEIDLDRAERAAQRRITRVKVLKDMVERGEISITEGEVEIKKVEVKLSRSLARVKAARQSKR
jgi:F-type H+-transporting ATPase subunit epsilon